DRGSRENSHADAFSSTWDKWTYDDKSKTTEHYEADFSADTADGSPPTLTASDEGHTDYEMSFESWHSWNNSYTYPEMGYSYTDAGGPEYTTTAWTTHEDWPSRVDAALAMMQMEAGAGTTGEGGEDDGPDCVTCVELGNEGEANDANAANDTSENSGVADTAMGPLYIGDLNSPICIQVAFLAPGDDIVGTAAFLNGLGVAGTVTIDPNSPNWEGAIRDLMALRPGRSICTVIIASHGGSGEIGPLDAAVLANSNSGGYKFLDALRGRMCNGGSIDVRACSVASGQSGCQFVSNLSRIVGVNVHATSDCYAAFPHGQEWIGTPQGTLLKGTTYKAYEGSWAQYFREAYESFVKNLSNKLSGTK
ncbi:MAG: DUF4347 domain-containing protein, partial [Planctomycetota bacterium]